VVVKIIGLYNKAKRKKMDKKKILLIGGLAALGYEGYRAYNISNGIILTYNNFRLSMKDKKLLISFNVVITNQSGKNIDLNGVSGNLKYMGNVLLNYSADLKKPLPLIVGKTTSLPITITTNSIAMLTMIAGGTSKVVDLSYNIGVSLKLLGFIPLTLPIKFIERIDLTPYIKAVSGISSRILDFIKTIKPKDQTTKVEVINEFSK
jgi:hypothetical protein